MQAGKGGGQQDIIRAARDQHLLVSRIGHAFVRCDEFGAHIGEVAAERLSRAQRMPVSYPSRQHDRPIEEPTHGAYKHEGVEPAGLPAGTGSQKNEAIGASFPAAGAGPA